MFLTPKQKHIDDIARGHRAQHWWRYALMWRRQVFSHFIYFNLFFPSFFLSFIWFFIYCWCCHLIKVYQTLSSCYSISTRPRKNRQQRSEEGKKIKIILKLRVKRENSRYLFSLLYARNQFLCVFWIALFLSSSFSSSSSSSSSSSLRFCHRPLAFCIYIIYVMYICAFVELLVAKAWHGVRSLKAFKCIYFFFYMFWVCEEEITYTLKMLNRCGAATKEDFMEY